MSQGGDTPALMDLPRFALLNIMINLSDAVDVLSFGASCRVARMLATDESLWRSLARSVHSGDVEPAAWGAANARHLYLGLLRPFAALLQGGGWWHSRSCPDGVLLRVEAEPPRLVARSFYAQRLNEDDLLCHQVFQVKFPHRDSPDAPLVRVQDAALYSAGGLWLCTHTQWHRKPR